MATKKAAREIIEKINALKAQLCTIQSNIEFGNYTLLVEEVCNLMDGVGGGYTCGDFYAPDRYYSKIPGVKNIRFSSVYADWIEVKIESPIGELVPNSIELDGNKYDIRIIYSKNYNPEMDY